MARSCTDVFWVILAVGACFGLVSIVRYAQLHGDCQRLFRGTNARGEVCGVHWLQQSRPYVFYCPDWAKETLDTEKPVCVSSCPRARTLMWECAGVAYSSIPVGGRFCLPTDERIVQHMTSHVSSLDISELVQKLSQLPQVWLTLAIAGGAAFVFGYMYLALLEVCAGLFVWVCLSVACAAPSALGAYLIWQTKFGGSSDVPSSAGQAVEDEENRFFVGVACAAVGALLFIVICYSRSSISTAIEAVKISADCLSDEPSLLLNPLIELIFKAFGLVGMMGCLLLVLSCGKITSGSGLYRSVEYTSMEKAYIGLVVFMALWACEFATSLSQFAVAWAVQKWYYGSSEEGRQHAPCLSLLRGYATGVFFHLGSLILGSLLIALFRLARLVLQVVARQARGKQSDVATIVSRVLLCIVGCFDQLLVFLNKNAYIEIAISSTPFFAASQRAISVLGSQAVTVGVLNGATIIIQIAGVGLIVSGGALVTWFTCQNVSPFNDKSSQHYVSDPMFVTGASAVVCFLVAVAFAVVLDMVTDTTLYCMASDQMDGGGKTIDDSGSDDGRTHKRGRKFRGLEMRLRGAGVDSEDEDSE